ncbi:hypothetical protein GN109_07965 [Collimonas pratensis]|uniref:hypothetical protein n=1 Tax=Collimonas pratensis TaxID=279113 RepID=UPI00143CD029|nr:hypothetical protein [Collimonas pratensis]NKI69349.1 hypothetical protein [Collimonas pratensis]
MPQVQAMYASEARGVKPDMHRLLGVGAALALHASVLVPWWHAADVAGLAAMDAGREAYVNVQIIAAAVSVAAAPSSVAKPAYGETSPAKPAQASIAAVQAAHRLSTPTYYGPLEVDKGALPYSAPDPELLTGVAASGLPIRIRLYIDAGGMVTAIDKLQALDDDQQALERIEGMLRGTRFMPARLGGADVNSYQDLEFHIGPELNGASE